MEEYEEESVNENSVLGRQIVRANRIAERPVIDNSLSEILDMLGVEVDRSRSDYRPPVVRFSFIEAALLLTVCTYIYAKKVDILWDDVHIHLKRMVSFDSEENRIERQRLEERAQRYQRRRSRKIIELPDNVGATTPKKNAETFGVDWDEVANFQPRHFEKNPKLFSEWCKKMDINRDLQLVDRAYRSRPDKYCHFRSANDIITDKDQDDELVVHTSKMESVIALDELFSNQKDISDDFSLELLVESQLKQTFLMQRQLRYEDFEKYSGEFEKFASSYKDDYLNRRLNSSKSDLHQRKLRRISVASNVVAKLNKSDANRIFCQTCQVNVPRLSIDQLSRLSRLSVDEILECSSMCYNNMGNFQESKLSVDGQTCQVHVARLSIDNLSKLSGLSIDEVKKISEDNNIDSNIGMLENEENKAHDINNVELTTIQTDDNVEIQSESHEVPSMDLPELDELPPMGVTETNEVPPMGVPQPNDIPPMDVPEPEKLQSINEQNSQIINTVENIDSNRTKEIVKVSRQKRACDKLNDTEKLPRKTRKLSKAALKKIATGVSANLRDFNVFYSAHYQTEEGEGEVEVPEFERGDPLLNSSFIEEDHNSEDDLPLSQLASLSVMDSGICSQGISTQDVATCSQVPGADEVTNLQDGATTSQALTTQDGGADDGICMDDGADMDATVGISPGDKTIDSGILTDIPDSGFQSPTSPLTGNANPGNDNDSTGITEEAPLYQKVHEWKRYMHSVFKNKKSDAFDIHEYGANIMENLEMGKPKKFADIVKGKSAAEVSRFFMSTLQLANTMNIDIQGAQSGKLSNDTFALNLNTKERYHERLDEYMAPSEEFQQENKKNMKRRGAGCSGEYSGYKRYKNDG